ASICSHPITGARSTSGRTDAGPLYLAAARMEAASGTGALGALGASGTLGAIGASDEPTAIEGAPGTTGATRIVPVPTRIRNVRIAAPSRHTMDASTAWSLQRRRVEIDVPSSLTRGAGTRERSPASRR